jgi:hypothetical protein
MENSAVFAEIESSCPAQNAQLLGAKFPPKRIMVPITPSIVFDLRS